MHLNGGWLRSTGPALGSAAGADVTLGGLGGSLLGSQARVRISQLFLKVMDLGELCESFIQNVCGIVQKQVNKSEEEVNIGSGNG